MTEEAAPRRRGRPPTGETPKRNIRIGDTWTQGEALAKQLGVSMTAYVEDALKRHNAKVERDLRRSQPVEEPCAPEPSGPPPPNER